MMMMLLLLGLVGVSVSVVLMRVLLLLLITRLGHILRVVGRPRFVCGSVWDCKHPWLWGHLSGLLLFAFVVSHYKSTKIGSKISNSHISAMAVPIP